MVAKGNYLNAFLMQPTLHTHLSPHAKTNESDPHNGQFFALQVKYMLLSCSPFGDLGLYNSILYMVRPIELGTHILWQEQGRTQQ